MELSYGICENCYGIGKSTGGGNGIAGRYDKTPTATNCYGRGQTFDATNLGDKYQADVGINNGYPILKWQLENTSIK